ncbi:hypothetical protein HYX19_03450 [Candidatus Woesearchaeota archaeon]|nr:hypothetical protein [Candidatus Woesearchaeota archaeon]
MIDPVELREKLKPRLVSEVYLSLEYQLNILTPDGGKNHKRDNIRSFLCGNLYLYKNNLEETFITLEANDSRKYEQAFKKISEAINLFNLTI